MDTPCRTDFKDENAMNTDEPTVAPLVATSSRQVSPPYRVAVDELIALVTERRPRARRPGHLTGFLVEHRPLRRDSAGFHPW